MKEKTIISVFTLAGSLLTYFYAKQTEKDAVPYVMIGGFIGAFVGESLILSFNNKKNGGDNEQKPDGK